MGYAIAIGNAIPFFSSDDEELFAEWKVEDDDCIDFTPAPNDKAAGNMRWSIVCAWQDFAKISGLYELFYDVSCGLMRETPGCFRIKLNHFLQIKSALKRRRGISKKPAGWDKEGTPENERQYDPVLARLIWLEFWFKRALQTAKIPAIENY